MELSSAARTDVGLKRRANEDSYVVVAEQSLYVVADGLGGHVAGKQASRTGTCCFVRSLATESARPAADAMRHALRSANAAIRADAEREPAHRGMGTTLVALWIRGRDATLVHVGDSRIYLMRDGRLSQLTLDHSLVGELIARGELRADQAFDHPQRHVITRALGVCADVEPDVAVLRVQPGDLFVLCSDGICAQIKADDIRAILCEDRQDLDRAATRMIDHANQNGGEDNATVILVAT